MTTMLLSRIADELLTSPTYYQFLLRLVVRIKSMDDADASILLAILAMPNTNWVKTKGADLR